MKEDTGYDILTFTYGGREFRFVPELQDYFVAYEKYGVNYILCSWDLEFVAEIMDAMEIGLEYTEERFSDLVMELTCTKYFGDQIDYPKGLYFGDLYTYREVYGNTVITEAGQDFKWNSGVNWLVSDWVTAAKDVELWAGEEDADQIKKITYRGIEAYSLYGYFIFDYTYNGLNYIVEVWYPEDVDNWLDFFAGYLENLEPLTTAEK